MIGGVGQVTRLTETLVVNGLTLAEKLARS